MMGNSKDKNVNMKKITSKITKLNMKTNLNINSNIWYI